METRAKFHFSWVGYALSLSSLGPCGTAQTMTDTGCAQALLRNCVEYLADCSPFKNVTPLTTQ